MTLSRHLFVVAFLFVLVRPLSATGISSAITHAVSPLILGSVPKVESHGWRFVDQKEFIEFYDALYRLRNEHEKKRRLELQSETEQSLRKITESFGRKELYDVDCVERTVTIQNLLGGKTDRVHSVLRRFRATLSLQNESKGTGRPKSKIAIESSSGVWSSSFPLTDATIERTEGQYPKLESTNEWATMPQLAMGRGWDELTTIQLRGSDRTTGVAIGDRALARTVMFPIGPGGDLGFHFTRVRNLAPPGQEDAHREFQEILCR